MTVYQHFSFLFVRSIKIDTENVLIIRNFICSFAFDQESGNDES